MIELAEIDPLTARYCILRRLRKRAVRDVIAGHGEGHGWRASLGGDGSGPP
jgi:hypothetical protein